MCLRQSTYYTNVPEAINYYTNVPEAINYYTNVPEAINYYTNVPEAINYYTMEGIFVTYLMCPLLVSECGRLKRTHEHFVTD